jgi:succinoglycan biosynthesis transport protein ExoP
METLSQLVGLRQQIYNDLLLDYEEARTNEQFRANAITIAEPAYLPENPSTPGVFIISALGLAAGLATGVILAFVLEGLDDSIQDIEDVQAMTTLPILCKVQELKRKLRLYANLNLMRAEVFSILPVFDQLCARLRLFDATPKFTSFVFTSPESGTGKSTIAANCALSLAHRGKKVVLFDLDFHRAPKHTYFGMANTIGLSNVLYGETQWDEVLQATPHPNLRVITAGSSPHVPYELLTPKVIGNLLDELRTGCDYVLMDMPALPDVADPSAFFSQVDGIILIVARHKTQRQNFRYALQQIEEFKAKIAGIVVNKETSPQLYR